MFDALTPLQVVAGAAGVWIAGYAAGYARAWLRSLRYAA